MIIDNLLVKINQASIYYPNEDDGLYIYRILSQQQYIVKKVRWQEDMVPNLFIIIVEKHGDDYTQLRQHNPIFNELSLMHYRSLSP
jgi:SPX domain protein involved in polyphosphate accumulation